MFILSPRSHHLQVYLRTTLPCWYVPAAFARQTSHDLSTAALRCQLRESMGVGADSTNKAFHAADVTALMKRPGLAIYRDVIEYNDRDKCVVSRSPSTTVLI